MAKTKKYFDIYDWLNLEEKQFLTNVWNHRKIAVWWVVNYKSMISNWIKFFTQSIFSHINFFDPYSKTAIWAEDLEAVVLRNYQEENYWEFYYISKTIDLDYLAFV